MAKKMPRVKKSKDMLDIEQNIKTATEKETWFQLGYQKGLHRGFEEGASVILESFASEIKTGLQRGPETITANYHKRLAELLQEAFR
jgi:flagellar biosynthesis/type III secretory pathway protein FliH